MRITTRMTLTLTLLALVLFGGYGVYFARRSQGELEQTVARKTRLIGQGLTAGIEHDLRRQDWVHVQDTLDRLDASDITVRIIDREGSARAQTPSAAPLDGDDRSVIAGALAGEEPFVVIRGDGAMRAVYATPLFDDRRIVIGALLIGQSLVGVSRTIAESRRDAAIAVVAFVLAAAAAASWTGRSYVAAPIARLVAAMRRVRAGDLSRFESRERTTEIRELGREFDAMVEQLDAARQQLVDEEAHRVELERRLRHADKLIAIGHLAAGVAHEVGSPLQVLVGRARALATREYDPPGVQRQATIIAEQGERITGIVERLLGYTRRHPEQPVPTDVGEAVRSIVDLLANEAERRGVALHSEVEDGVPLVIAPPGTSQQIVLNLAMNALDATPRGGEVRIDVRAARHAGDAAEIIVSDTGRGIPESERDRVFDAFFTTRAHDGGTGLGLAVVRALVNDLGGRIELSSEISGGTRIAVRLPRPTEASRA
ncbi:MAG TPA: HAMP domain-containing sensor histidine kinase [Nannocystaceae bacterium]|nr:HAMP domain-containing sensor histidine kinase [Nannocystaceae bacterium]